MANEATIVFRTHHAIPFTVANVTGIERGAILKMTDPLTAALSDGADDVIAGIAASEKIASDGKIKLGVYRGGIFKVTLSGSATVGDPLGTTTGSVNQVKVAGVLSGSKILGYALETGTTGETILMEVRPGIARGGAQ